MSERTDSERRGERREEQRGERRDDEPAPDTGVTPSGEEHTQTPFDHPLFLPAILLGLSLWFFYDGFLNRDPDMLEHLTFNRGGFALLGLATLWYGYKGWKELREERGRREGSSGPSGDDVPPSSPPPPPIA